MKERVISEEDDIKYVLQLKEVLFSRIIERAPRGLTHVEEIEIVIYEFRDAFEKYHMLLDFAHNILQNDYFLGSLLNHLFLNFIPTILSNNQRFPHPKLRLHSKRIKNTEIIKEMLKLPTETQYIILKSILHQVVTKLTTESTSNNNNIHNLSTIIKETQNHDHTLLKNAILVLEFAKYDLQWPTSLIKVLFHVMFGEYSPILSASLQSSTISQATSTIDRMDNKHDEYDNNRNNNSRWVDGRLKINFSLLENSLASMELTRIVFELFQHQNETKILKSFFKYHKTLLNILHYHFDHQFLVPRRSIMDHPFMVICRNQNIRLIKWLVNDIKLQWLQPRNYGVWQDSKEVQPILKVFYNIRNTSLDERKIRMQRSYKIIKFLLEHYNNIDIPCNNNNMTEENNQSITNGLLVPISTLKIWILLKALSSANVRVVKYILKRIDRKELEENWNQLLCKLLKSGDFPFISQYLNSPKLFPNAKIFEREGAIKLLVGRAIINVQPSRIVRFDHDHVDCTQLSVNEIIKNKMIHFERIEELLQIIYDKFNSAKQHEIFINIMKFTFLTCDVLFLSYLISNHSEQLNEFIESNDYRVYHVITRFYNSNSALGMTIISGSFNNQFFYMCMEALPSFRKQLNNHANTIIEDFFKVLLFF